MAGDSNDSDSSSMHGRCVLSPTPTTKNATKEADLDAQLNQTLRDIEQVDSLLQSINERKCRLIKKYDRLKDEKLQIKSKALANENWNEGISENLVLILIRV